MVWGPARRAVSLLRERRAGRRAERAFLRRPECRDWEGHARDVAAKLFLPQPAANVRPGALWAVTMVRNEADIIERTIRHFVAQGVEAILVSDNGSTDETPEILERLAREFPVFVARDEEPAYYQAVKMTLLADWARQQGAGWIIPFDADELWFAPDGTLAEWLAAQPHDVVVARIHNLFPGRRPGEWALDVTPHLYPKVAFRALEGARLSTGNHEVLRRGSRGSGLRIAHIPWRSYPQFAGKLRHGALALALTDLGQEIGEHWRAAGTLAEERLQELWDDIRHGQPAPSLGWSPAGRTVAVDVAQWRTWDPDEVLAAREAGANPALTVLYARPPGPGWDAITLLARRCSALLGARHLELNAGRAPGRLGALRARLGGGRGAGPLLVIAASPDDLVAMSRRLGTRRGGRLVGWLIAPGAGLPGLVPTRGRARFDAVFVSDPSLVDAVGDRLGAPAQWLPWGVEVLNLPALRDRRPVDLLRLGWAPDAWNDDVRTREEAARRGLTFAPAPATGTNLFDTQQRLIDALGRAKFVLVGGGDAARSGTEAHPGGPDVRWAQALAAGASPVGKPPADASVVAPACEGAFLEPWVDDLAVGLDGVTDAARLWSGGRARRNRLHSLQRLDWRHRFAVLAQALGVPAPLLAWELDALARAEAALGAVTDGAAG